MGFSSFIIEIPERPRYMPGSGPPLAPITLAPDNTKTGWILVDLVEVGGIPRYIVTPKDDPVLRKAVKPDRILDWVSPKVFEDFEYDRYKKDIQLQEERKAKRLARAAALKVKNAKKFAEASAGVNFLAGQQRRLPSRANGYYSFTGPESEDLSRENSETRTIPMKRKVLKYEGSVNTKRQAVVGIVAKPVRQLEGLVDGVTSQDKEHMGNDELSAPAAAHARKLAASYEPILPPTKLVSSFSRHDSGSGGLYISGGPLVGSFPRTLPSKLISGPSKVELARANIGENSFPKTANPQLPANGWLRSFTYGSMKASPPILPPQKNTMKHFSKPVSQSISKNYAGSPILPPSNATRARESNISTEIYNQGFWVPSSLPRSKGVEVDLFIPATSGSPVRSLPIKAPGPNLAPYSKRNFTPHSQPSTVLEDQIEEAFEDDETNNEEAETWEINSILATERRPHPTSGERVKQYLIDWAGDYEPSWEPRECVSDDAILNFDIEQGLKKQKVEEQELMMRKLNMRESMREANARDGQARGNRLGGNVANGNHYDEDSGKVGDVPHERNGISGDNQDGFSDQKGTSLDRWSKGNAKGNATTKELDDITKSLETAIADTEALEEVEAEAQLLAKVSQLRTSSASHVQKSLSQVKNEPHQLSAPSPSVFSTLHLSSPENLHIAGMKQAVNSMTDHSSLELEDEDGDDRKEHSEISF